jgi:hypothetical protein
MPDQGAITGTPHHVRVHARASASAGLSCASASDEHQEPSPVRPDARFPMRAAVSPCCQRGRRPSPLFAVKRERVSDTPPRTRGALEDPASPVKLLGGGSTTRRHQPCMTIPPSASSKRRRRRRARGSCEAPGLAPRRARGSRLRPTARASQCGASAAAADLSACSPVAPRGAVRGCRRPRSRSRCFQPERGRLSRSDARERSSSGLPAVETL